MAADVHADRALAQGIVTATGICAVTGVADDPLWYRVIVAPEQSAEGYVKGGVKTDIWGGLKTSKRAF